MISLVTATLGRVEELTCLLDSLMVQIYKDFEIIIVDQNEHYLINNLLEKYSNTIRIKYIRSSVKGLSYNRNIGLKYCEGNIVGFPDDDCFYDKNVLNNIYELLNNKKYKFATIQARDAFTKSVYVRDPNKDLSRFSIFKHCISYNVFVVYNVDLSFDEKLGVGTYYSSGEETDYLFSLLSSKDRGRFVTGTFVYHPQNAASIDYKRAYSYALGFGGLFKKEIILRRNYIYICVYMYYLLRSFGGIIISKNRLFHLYTLLGRIKGFIVFPI